MLGTHPFSVSPLAPAVGSIVTGVDLTTIDEAGMRSLIALLHERGVVAIQGQHLDDAQFARFGGEFGRPLEFFRAQDRDSRYPEIIRIDNSPATPATERDGAVHWHSDSSYEEEPAAITMLYGKESPDEGGVTQFASSAAAYDALPDEMKRRIDPLVAIHELGAAQWIDGETRPDPNRPPHNLPRQRHPLVMRHPVTGRKAIFTSGTACGIEGMADADARALIRMLREHVVQPQFRTAYKVMPGDILIWDNFSVVHSASPIDYSDEPGKRRRLQRISTKGLPRLCMTA